MTDASYRSPPELTPTERDAQRLRLRPAIHDELTAWGAWLNSIRSPAPGGGSASVEARLMRTAPGDLAADLPRVWLCGGCSARIVRFRTPARCPECHGTQLRAQHNYSHGRETPATRGRDGDGIDAPGAEAIDRAVAALGQVRPRLRAVVMLAYVRGYSVRLIADYFAAPWYQARGELTAAQCWVEGWMAARVRPGVGGA